MIRLLLALLLAVQVGAAHAAPPPQPGPARFEGFHEVYVTPDAFADGLVPLGAPPVVEPPPAPTPPPPARTIVQVVLDPQATTAVGHTADTLADHLRTVDGVTRVEVDPDGASLLVEAVGAREVGELAVPTTQEQPVPLGSLGQVLEVPDIRPRMPTGGVPRPQVVPAPEPGHDLVLENVVGVRVTVRVGDVVVGELKPRGVGVIHDVRPGTYEVGFRGPTGFERRREVETQAR